MSRRIAPKGFGGEPKAMDRGSGWAGREMIESLDKAQKMVLHWRVNPVQAAKDIFDVDLEPHQRIALNLMWFNDVQTNILSRGTGKTFLLGPVCFAGGHAQARAPHRPDRPQLPPKQTRVG